MDGSSRRDRDGRGQTYSGRPRGDNARDTRERRRSQSPQARERRDYRNDGGRWDQQERGERGQRGGARGAYVSGDHSGRRHDPQHPRDAPASTVGRPVNSSSSGSGGGRGRGQANGAQAGNSTPAKQTGGSSMPFIKNDKPYQYNFKDDDIQLAQAIGEMPDDATLRQVMGFAKFRTSHELKIPDNEHNHGIRTVKQSKYRQYMNRRDGFNRPLSPPHD